MIAWLLLTLALSAVFGGTAARVARRLPPAIATWFLTAGSTVAGIASSVALGMLALVAVGQLPVVASRAAWSEKVLYAQADASRPVGVVAFVAIVLLGLAALAKGVRTGVAIRQAYRLAASLPGCGELCVLDADAQHAAAVPGHPGRIVVSSGLLRTLDGSQRRALLAHERAHLRHRHHWHRSVVAITAAANPLLRPMMGASALACERWADEDAARVAGRRSIALAITRAASGGSSTFASSVVLAAAELDVADRLHALQASQPQLNARRLLLPAILLLALGVTIAVSMHDVERLFEHAQAAYNSTHR